MYRNILVPVAIGDEARSSAELDVARSLLSEGGVITLIHVVEPIPVYVTAYVAVDIMAQSHGAMRAELEQLAKDHGPAETLLIEGHPGRTIVEHAKTKAADLIVMSAHRPGFEDIFVGSTTTYVVRHAPCTVHVVR
ncbi:universal stress protein [Puniceibacterium sp. IMCC21224]|uniref:universal stress protein n=1 Tax=Puniceibacterium sp. IMCC21224 TaxID=1618204 RepID=UPI00064DCABD|nr:universal stress protein [Puniceibacterium sp. IMCC21224]KMK66372.1 universal stress protein UspA-like protein [Puniceibacterium sp. IMCC21224]